MHTHWQEKVTNSSEAILRARVRDRLFGREGGWNWRDGLQERIERGGFDRDKVIWKQHEEYTGSGYVKFSTPLRSSVVCDDDIWYTHLYKSTLEIPGERFQLGNTKRLIKDVMREALGNDVDFKVKWDGNNGFRVSIPEKDFEPFRARLYKNAPNSLIPEISNLERYARDKRWKEQTGR
ncbi:MAG: hypothetical protein K2X09_01105 [Rickettsiales bacterium]|nr:hypothetical protein [Rickettsiales bacterium]